MSKKFGTSPIGRATSRRPRTDTARTELLASLGALFELAPTANELEMIDTILSAAMWSYEGYSKVFDFAYEMHQMLHKEKPPWIKR